MSRREFEQAPQRDHAADGGDSRLSPRDTWVILLVIAALVLMLCFTSPRLSDAAVVHATHAVRALSHR